MESFFDCVTHDEKVKLLQIGLSMYQELTKTLADERSASLEIMNKIFSNQYQQNIVRIFLNIYFWNTNKYHKCSYKDLNQDMYTPKLGFWEYKKNTPTPPSKKMQ